MVRERPACRPAGICPATVRLKFTVLSVAMARRDTLFAGGTMEDTLGNAKDGDRWSYGKM
jgi:hypothetical protein